MKSSNVRLLALMSLGVLSTAAECDRACTRLCVAATESDECHQACGCEQQVSNFEKLLCDRNCMDLHGDSACYDRCDEYFYDDGASIPSQVEYNFVGENPSTEFSEAFQEGCKPLQYALCNILEGENCLAVSDCTKDDGRYLNGLTGLINCKATCEDFFFGDWCQRTCIADYFKNIRRNEQNGYNTPLLHAISLQEIPRKNCWFDEVSSLEDQSWDEFYSAIVETCTPVEEEIIFTGVDIVDNSKPEPPIEDDVEEKAEPPIENDVEAKVEPPIEDDVSADVSAENSKQEGIDYIQKVTELLADSTKDEEISVDEVIAINMIDWAQFSSQQVLFGRKGMPTVVVQKPSRFLGTVFVSTEKIPEGSALVSVEADGSVLQSVNVAQLNSELASSTNMMRNCNNYEMMNHQGFCSSYKQAYSSPPNFHSVHVRPPARPTPPTHSHRTNSYSDYHPFQHIGRKTYPNNPEFHLPTMFDIPFHEDPSDYSVESSSASISIYSQRSFVRIHYKQAYLPDVQIDISMAWMESSNLIIYHDDFTKNHIVIMRIHNDGYDELHLFPLVEEFAKALPAPSGAYFTYEDSELKTKEQLHEYDYIELSDLIFINSTAIFHYYGEDVPVIQILSTLQLSGSTIESLKNQKGLYSLDISDIKLTLSSDGRTAYMMHEIQRYMQLAFNLKRSPSLEIVEVSDSVVSDQAYLDLFGLLQVPSPIELWVISEDVLLAELKKQHDVQCLAVPHTKIVNKCYEIDAHSHLINVDTRIVVEHEHLNITEIRESIEIYKEPKKIYIEPCSHSTFDEISIDFVTPIEKQIIIPVRNESLDLAVVDIIANMTNTNRTIDIPDRLIDLREHEHFEGERETIIVHKSYNFSGERNVTIGDRDVVIVDGEVFYPGHNETFLNYTYNWEHNETTLEFVVNVTQTAVAKFEKGYGQKEQANFTIHKPAYEDEIYKNNSLKIAITAAAGKPGSEEIKPTSNETTIIRSNATWENSTEYHTGSKIENSTECKDGGSTNIDEPDVFIIPVPHEAQTFEVWNETQVGCVNCTQYNDLNMSTRAPTILPKWASDISVSLVPYKIPTVIEKLDDSIIFRENYTITTGEGKYEVVVEKNQTRVQVINSTEIEAHCQIWHQHKCIVWVSPPAINDTEFSYLKKFDVFSKIQKTIRTTSDDECKISLGEKILSNYSAASYQNDLQESDLDDMTTLLKMAQYLNLFGNQMNEYHIEQTVEIGLIPLIRHPGCFNDGHYQEEIDYLMQVLGELVGQGRSTFFSPNFFQRIASTYIQRVIVNQDGQLLRAQKVVRTVDQHTFVTQASMLMHAIDFKSHDVAGNTKVLRTLNYMMLRVNGPRPLYLTSFNSTARSMQFASKNDQVFLINAEGETEEETQESNSTIVVTALEGADEAEIAVTAVSTNVDDSDDQVAILEDDSEVVPLSGSTLVSMEIYQINKQNGHNMLVTPLHDTDLTSVVEIKMGKVSSVISTESLRCAWREEGAWFTTGAQLVVKGDNLVCRVHNFQGTQFAIMQDVQAALMMRANTDYRMVAFVLMAVAAVAVVVYSKNAKALNVVDDSAYGQQTLDKPLLEDEDSVHILGNGRKARYLQGTH